jgi:hypothetical protein
MQGLNNVLNYFLPGTLAANATITIVLPFAYTVESISAYASNASSANLIVGTAADTDGYLTATDIGDSNTALVIDKSDWNGVLYPQGTVGLSAAGVDHLRIPANTALVLTLDYDGAAGTAAANVHIYVKIGEG